MEAAETATERVELRHERLERKRMLRRQKAAASSGTNALTGETASTAPGSGNEISMARQPAPATMQAIADSIATLDFQTARTTEAVTGVLADIRAREQAYRDRMAAEALARETRLEEEESATTRANAAVTLRWADILKQSLPAELSASLRAQRDACAAVIASKQALLDGLSGDLKAREEQYIATLQAHREDIERMVTTMDAQYREMALAFETELSKVETTLLSERDAAMAANRKELEGLLEARKGMEARYVEEKLAREEAYTRELLDMQTADAENYHKLKVKLETDVAILEQQLENMKFTYLLNSEKLEYNYRVLTERDAENKGTLEAQRQRLARLRAALLRVRGDYKNVEAQFVSRNTTLTTDFTRLTKAYRDLQAKFRSFEAVDATHYAELVGMHHEEITALVNRVLAADRVITEQLLGRWWVPPEPVVPSNRSPSRSKKSGAGGASTAGGGGGGGSIDTRPSLTLNEEGSLSDFAAMANDASPAARLLLDGGVSLTLSDVGDSASGPGTAVGGGLFERRVSSSTQAAVSAFLGSARGDGAAAGGAPAAGGAAGGAAGPLDAAALTRLVRLLVASCASFLVDTSVQDACRRLQQGGKGEVADVLRADAVLQALGATSPADLADLVRHFEAVIADGVAGLAAAVEAITDAGHADDAASDGSGSRPGSASRSRPGSVSSGARPRTPTGKSNNAKHPMPDLNYGLHVPDPANPALPRIPPHISVVATLREWVALRQEAADAAAGAAAAPRPGVAVALANAEAGDAATTTTAGGGAGSSSKPAGEDPLKFWRDLGNTLPEARYRAWEALESALITHRDTLAARSTLIEECHELEGSNARLRELLDSYLTSPGVAGMEVPPTATNPSILRATGMVGEGGMLPPPSAGGAAAGGQRKYRPRP